MNIIEITGGARIGTANVTWPFAKLSVSPGKLELNASVVGNLIFRPTDIIALEPYYSMSSGIRIRHRVAAYKSDVIFWCGDPPVFLKQIHDTAYLDPRQSYPQEQGQTITDRQLSGSFPFKKLFAIGFGIVWNLLFLADIIPFILSENKGSPLRYGAFTAISFCLILSILLLVSEPVRKLVLKKGRNVSHISRFLFMIIGICVFMLLIITSFFYQ